MQSLLSFPLSLLLLFSLFLLPHSMCSDQQISDSFEPQIITQYVNDTVLRHNIYIGPCKFQNQSIFSISNQIKLSIIYHGDLQIEPIQLASLESEFSTTNDSFLIIYTNNPLNLSEIWTESAFSLFPTLQTLREAFDIDKPQVQLEILNQTSDGRFSQSKMVGDTILRFDISDPSFSASYLKQSSMQQWYFIVPAYLVIAFLVINYFIRSFYTDKNKYSDHGEIILHYLALASPTFMVQTLTAELMSFCYGFMFMSFPWMNETLGKLFGNVFDTTPFQMKVFFTDLNLGSTYCLALMIILVASVSGYVFISIQSKSSEVKQEKRSIFFNFLYNIFIYGALFNSMLSLQGIVYNSSNGSLSFANPGSSIFYIIGIIMLILIVADVIHLLITFQSKNFYKVRSIVKIMFLSLSHLNVNYFTVVMFFLDLLFAGAQYLINKQENAKSFNRLWVFKNILLNISLLLLIFMQIKLIAVIISFVFVTISIGVEIFEHYKLYQMNKLDHTNRNYRPAFHSTINHTNNTDRTKRMNSNLEYVEEHQSQLQTLPYSVTGIKSNRPHQTSKRQTDRKNRQIITNPLKSTIEYEPRNRRERRENSLKNQGLSANPNYKAMINSSNQHILYVRSQAQRYNQSHY